MLLGRLVVVERGLDSLVDDIVPAMTAGDHLIDGAPVRKAAKAAIVDEEVGLELAGEAGIIVGGLFRIVAIDGIELEVALAAPLDGIVEKLTLTTGPQNEPVAILAEHLQSIDGEGYLLADIGILVLDYSAVEVNCDNHLFLDRVVFLVTVVGIGIVAITAIVAVVAITIAAIAIATIAIATIAIAAIAAIAAVAIVVAVFTLRHIDTIEHDAGVEELAVVGQGIEEADIALRSIVGTADIAVDIGIAGYLEGIGNKTDRSGIEDDIVVISTEDIHDLTEIVAGQQLGGVGRSRTGKEKVEVVVDARRTELRTDIGLADFVLGEEIGDTLMAVAELEEATKGGFTNIETAEDYLLAKECKGCSKVGSKEGLTLTRGGRGEEDDAVALLHHKLDIGAETAEDLVDLIVLVLLDNDTGLALDSIAGNGNIGNDWKSGEAGDIVVTFDAIAHELEEQEDSKRNDEGQDDSSSQDGIILRADLASELRRVEELALVGSGSKRDGVLLALLEKQEVEVGLDTLLATNLIEDALLLRGHADTALILDILILYTLAMDIGRATGLHKGCADGALELVEGGSESLYLRGLLAGRLQEAVTILYNLVVVGDKTCGCSVGKTDIGGDNLIGVSGIIDVFTEIVEQLNLGVRLCQALLITAAKALRLAGSRLITGHGIAALIILDAALGGTKFLVDLLDTLVDKLLGLKSNLVLIGIGLVVVATDNLAKIIDGAKTIDIVHSQNCNRSVAAHGSGTHGCCV